MLIRHAKSIENTLTKKAERAHKAGKDITKALKAAGDVERKASLKKVTKKKKAVSQKKGGVKKKTKK